MQLTREMEDFCRREYPRLVRTLTLYTGRSDLARDVAHEALGRACAQWKRLQRSNSPGAWVNREAMKMTGRAGRRRGTAIVEREVSDAIPRRERSAAPAIRAAVTRLPPRQRTALLLRHFLDLSAFEAAELMDCDARAVRKLTRRAIDTLRRDPDVQRFAEASDAT